MSAEQNSEKSKSSNAREGSYVGYLQLLPQADILAELDSLEEIMAEDCRVSAFGLDANRCFELAIVEWTQRQLNHVAHSTSSGADLYIEQLQQVCELRDTLKGVSLKHLEKSIRFTVGVLDSESDPSLSPIQNLLSELVRRAREGEKL